MGSTTRFNGFGWHASMLGRGSSPACFWEHFTICCWG